MANKLIDANPLFLRKDFYAQVHQGNIPGYSLIHKYGRNASVPSGSWAFVNQLGFTGWPLSAATTVRIKAGGDVADDAGGNGARSVIVQGINADGNESSEIIVTNGVDASLVTTTLFLRIHRAWVSGVGVYGAANTDDIVIENGSGGTDLIQVTDDEGQTQFAGYTIPKDHTAELLGAFITVSSNQSADVRIMTREDIMDTTAPMKSKRLRLHFDGVLGSLAYVPHSPELTLNELTDIWVEAKGGASTQVSADFWILQIQDGYRIGE